MVRFCENDNCLWFPAESADRESPGPPPMILFLHGIGERGRGGVELDRVAAWGLPKFLRQCAPLLDRPFPFLVVAPQCPSENTWCDKAILDALDRLVEDLVDTERADPDRLCLTGFSMGGIGAFCLALRHPDRFAAVATVCGRCPAPEALPALAGRPLWVAYAEDDEIAELTAGSKQVIDTFAGSPNLTSRIYRPGWHEDFGPHVRTCDQAYSEPDLYHWFLDHTGKPLSIKSG
jgi:predicted peptidase